jgi:hypothetical protein
MPHVESGTLQDRLERQGPLAAELISDPLWAPLRGHPGFAALVQTP